MIVLKRFIILNEVDNSGISGIIKFENFMNKTRFEIKADVDKENSFVAININNEIITKNIEDERLFILDEEYDLSGVLQAIIVHDNNVVSHGSTNGGKMPFERLYKEYLKENSKVVENTQINIESNIQDDTQEIDNKKEEIVEIEPEIKNEKSEAMFYLKVEKKLNELFDTHEKEEKLESIFNSSRWAKIYINNEDYYVVGVIYEENNPMVICYGVPDNNYEKKQKNSEGATWFPVEGDYGYWLIYQSAEDGSIVETDS